jgi:hypothetical protein
MQAITAELERVAAIAERVGIVVLAAEAGLPVSTVRSFQARGWSLQGLTTCAKLIAAADRLKDYPRDKPLTPTELRRYGFGPAKPTRRPRRQNGKG